VREKEQAIIDGLKKRSNDQEDEGDLARSLDMLEDCRDVLEVKNE